MEKLNNDRPNFPAHWVEHLEVYTAAIDNRMDSTQKALRERGYDNLKHLWCAGEDEGAVGYRSGVAVALGLGPIPDAFLIDRDGTLLGRFHPDQFEREAVPLIEERVRAGVAAE